MQIIEEALQDETWDQKTEPYDVEPQDTELQRIESLKIEQPQLAPQSLLPPPPPPPPYPAANDQYYPEPPSYLTPGQQAREAELVQNLQNIQIQIKAAKGEVREAKAAAEAAQVHLQAKQDALWWLQEDRRGIIYKLKNPA